MGIVLDIILLAIFLLSIFLGYKKGLIGVVFNVCALIVALIITAVLFNPVTNLVIKNTEFDDNIKNAIIEKGYLEKNESEDEDNSINSYIEKYITNNIKDGINNTVEKNAQFIAEKIVSIGVAIVLFIFVRIVLILLKFVAEGLAELPIIKQFNALGGLAYGVIRGVLVIYIFLAICFFVVSVGNVEFISNAIDTSYLSKFLYEHNFILNLFL